MSGPELLVAPCSFTYVAGHKDLDWSSIGKEAHLSHPQPQQQQQQKTVMHKQHSRPSCSRQHAKRWTKHIQLQLLCSSCCFCCCHLLHHWQWRAACQDSSTHPEGNAQLLPSWGEVEGKAEGKGYQKSKGCHTRIPIYTVHAHTNTYTSIIVLTLPCLQGIVSACILS